MYRKILVPLALDHGISPNTLAIAKLLAGEDGEITALHVYEAAPATVSVYLDETLVKKGFDYAKQQLHEKTAGFDNIKPVMVKGHTYRAIVDHANDNDIDCIVMGSHKPGLSDYLLGSTAARVVRHAPCAVHVHR
ncbi:MAG: universal stress protein [Granulosicoccus sp.]